MMEQPIGKLLDDLGVTYDVPEGTLVSGAVVLLHVIDADGSEGVALRSSAGMGVVTRRGVIDLGAQLDCELLTSEVDDDD